MSVREGAEGYLALDVEADDLGSSCVRDGLRECGNGELALWPELAWAGKVG